MNKKFVELFMGFGLPHPVDVVLFATFDLRKNQNK